MNSKRLLNRIVNRKGFNVEYMNHRMKRHMFNCYYGHLASGLSLCDSLAQARLWYRQ